MSTLHIKPTGFYDEVEFTWGQYTAYGIISADGESFRLSHAPTQEDFNLIFGVICGSTPAELAATIQDGCS